MDIALREKITVTIAEASALTGIGPKKLMEWADTDDTFPVFRIGRKRMIEVEMLKEWLRNQCRNRVGMDSTKVARIIRRRKK